MNALATDTRLLADFLSAHGRVVVLTGAGISAESGIPTYRDHAGTWLTGNPIEHRDFIAHEQTRRRYWARSWYGWPVIRDARPNGAHYSLAALEQHGHIELLITQNVDRLHQRAGSERVIDLHGRVDRVRCLVCEEIVCRDQVQQRLGAGSALGEAVYAATRPDGDMDIPEHLYRHLVMPRCKVCDGDLMPDVVFFGGNIPRQRVEACLSALERADALLVVGSSLMVFSGFRFCRRARELGKPLAIVNPGVTRADDLAQVRLRSEAAPLLESALRQLA